ncbi:hypothetical protein LXL04_031423 [Taraxacum kok-saghyz]
MRRNLLTKHVAAVVKYQKDPIRALEMFNSAKKEDGFKHNLVTYKCMIENLGSHGKFEAMEGVFAEMRADIDSCLSEGAYVSAMKSYGRKGKVQEAVNVFERMDFYNCEPGVHSYNAIMNILVEYGYFDQAHKVYMRMKDKGIVPDVYTFTIRIKSFCRTKRSVAALRLLKNMPASGCELNAVTYCTVISGFYEENNQPEAYQLFDEMLKRSIFPDIVTFNKLIHILCKKGDVQESERLFNKVLKRGISPNVFTFNVFIQGLCKTKQLNQAAKMLKCANSQNLTPDVVTFNTLIWGLCKNSKVMEAESYLQMMVNKGLEPDDFTYNTIIDGFCKMGMVERASKILKDAIFMGFKPDKFTYLSLIYGSCQDGDVDRAMDVFRDCIRKGVKPVTIMYNTLIKGLAKHGLIMQALDLMEEMQKNMCFPDTWTYNLLIDGLCKMGCVLDAERFMNDGLDKGFIPDIYTFNTLLDGYCKQSMMSKAIEMVDSMWDHVTPDAITYRTLLNGLCKNMKSEDVIGAFQEMKNNGFVPDVISYNTLIESLCKARKLDKAMEVFQEMEKTGLHPDEVIYGTLINGFCENGDLETAYELFRQHNLSQTIPIFNIMIKGFSEKMKMDDARNLFDEMSEPDNFTFRCMIEGFCRIGDVENGYKFLVDEIEHGFIPSVGTFGHVINCLCVKHSVREAVGVVYLMVEKDVVPESVNTIFEADKRAVAAPKIVVEELLRKSHISYYAYELLYDGVRDKKILKKIVYSTKFLSSVASAVQVPPIPPTKPQSQPNFTNTFDPYKLLNESAKSRSFTLEETKIIHTHFLKTTSFDSSPEFSNYLLRCYYKSSAFDHALKVFDAIPNPDINSWNLIITCHNQNHKYADSWGAFCRMHSLGYYPNEFTYGSALSACISSNLVNNGKLLYSLALKHGFSLDGYVRSGMIDLFLKSSNFNDALSVFHDESCGNVVCWNAIISGAIKHNEDHLGLNLFQQMCRGLPSPNKFTFPSVFSACAKSQQLDLGKLVHGLVIKYGEGDDVFVSTAIIDFYSKCGHVDEAVKKFSRMSVHNVVSWTAIITGEQIHSYTLKTGIINNPLVGCSLFTMYSKCNSLNESYKIFKEIPEKDEVSWASMIAGFTEHGFAYKALEFFQEMLINHTVSDEKTLTPVLLAISSLRSLKSGKEVHGFIFRRAISAGSPIVHMYTKCGNLKSAKFAFNMMPFKDPVSCSSLISGYAQNGQIQDAFHLFRDLIISGFDIDSFTISSIIQSVNGPETGAQLHARTVKLGLESETSIGSSLITMYSKSGNLEDSRKSFEQITNPDVITYTAMIHGYAQNGNGSSALKVYNRMIESGTAPDSVTFIGLLTACSHGGLVNEAFLYFDSMVKDYGIEPGLRHYACMVDVLGRAGRLKEAVGFIEGMAVEPDGLVWGTLLAACKVHEEVEIGKIAARKVIELVPMSDGGYVGLSNIWAGLGEWEEVLKIRDEMKGTGVKKQPGWSYI